MDLQNALAVQNVNHYQEFYQNNMAHVHIHTHTCGKGSNSKAIIVFIMSSAVHQWVFWLLLQWASLSHSSWKLNLQWRP